MEKENNEFIENSLDYRRKRWIKKLQKIWEVDYKSRFEARVGEIYEVEFGENVGDEFSGRHFAMVLQNSSASNTNVLVIPITSRYEEFNSEYKIRIVSNVEGKIIEGGFVIGETKWISKQRINKWSCILGEDITDPIRCVGKYDCDRNLLKKLMYIGG